MFVSDLFEAEREPTLVDALRDFLPLAVNHLGLIDIPKIHLLRDMENENTKVPTFGQFTGDGSISLAIHGRHPVDILRTLAHEMTHFKQNSQGELSPESGETGSDEENEANAEAGVILRLFNTKFPQYLKMDPIICP